MIEIPDGAIEILRVTARSGRVMFRGYVQFPGETFGYQAEGAMGSRLPAFRDILDRALDCKEWPGGKTAEIRGHAAYLTPYNDVRAARVASL